MIQSENLVEKLRHRRSRLLDPEAGALAAAVAVLLRGAAGGTELLFLQRVQRDGDPWSGHISFPGGKIDASDESPRHAAIRETREETAIDLDHADFVCRLDDQATNLSKVHVAGFVFYLANGSDLTLNHEIRSAFWLPLSELMDADRYVTTTVAGEWGEREVCAIDLLDGKGPVLWGLTYRFTAQVLAGVGHELPGGSEVQLR